MLIESKNAFFDEVLEMVRKIPISEIIYDTYQMPIGFCPFHNDRHAGSFRVIKKINRYQCFSCGEKGDGIQFVQLHEDIGFKEAVWKLALEFEIVTIEQFESYQNGKMFNSVIKRPPRLYDEIYKNIESEDIASDEILDNVYRVFSRGTALLKENHRLSKEHLHHLKDDRGLSEKEIERAGYFTIPNRSKYLMKEFLNTLKNEFNYDDEILKDVPGFYWLNKAGGMTFVAHKGIGIPVKNEREEIIGIQIRRDTIEPGEQRYVWFSSSFANEHEGMSFGTGSGSPIHISYPIKNYKPGEIFITEGIFKSEQITKHYQSICVSVQGVQSWRGKIDHFINYLEEEIGLPVHTINVCFDADVSENIHVYKAFKDMYKTLAKQFPMLKFYYYWWDMEFGKGIDDLLLNGFKSEIKKMNCKDYVVAYDTLIDEIETKYGDSINDLDKELIQYEYIENIAPLF